MFCSASAAGRSPVTTHSTPATSRPILIQSSGEGRREQHTEAAGDGQDDLRRRGPLVGGCDILTHMSRRADQAGDGPPIDVFVSYCPADERWAAWIAWQLEVAGFRTLLRAWDLPVGSPVEDFAERGMRSAAVTLAVLSRAYLGSGRVTAERQVALRTDPARLVTVRVDDGPLAGVPPTLPAVDLGSLTDPRAATAVLLARLAEVVGARDRTPRTARRRPVGSAACGATARRRGPPRADRPSPVPARRAPDHRRRRAAARRGTPLRARARRSRRADHRARPAGPDPGRGHPADRRGRPRTRPAGRERGRHRVGTAATAGRGAGVPHRPAGRARPRPGPDGHRAGRAGRVPFGVRGLLPRVRGPRTDAGRALLPQAGAVGRAVRRPLRRPGRARLRRRAAVDALRRAGPAGGGRRAELDHGDDPPVGDDYGRIGEAQASWFAERLRPFEESGWLRVGVVRHDPLPGASGADDPATLRDAATLDGLLGNRLNLLLHGPGPGGTSAELLGDRLPVLPAARPGGPRSST